MATYNGAPFLREQLDSILSQLHSEDELIVSDDHSTDDTRSIIASYDDERIKVFTNPGKRGHKQNFANAMAHASGEFIALSDQDDIWVENRLERMLDMLCGMPPHSLVVGGFTEFGRVQHRTRLRRLGPSPRTGLVPLYRLFVGQARYFGSTFMFRRDLIRFVLPIPEHIEAHDIWIAMNACVYGKMSHLEETTLMRRLHGHNLTPLRHRGLWVVFKSRVFYLVGLLQTAFR
jgi:glycosyltransferase involved in cell wall biosynthesis